MKPKCPKCGTTNLSMYGYVFFEVECLKCGWSRRVSRAAIIRLAVQKRGALKDAYSLGYSHGHEAVMRDRIRDAMEARRNG